MKQVFFIFLFSCIAQVAFSQGKVKVIVKDSIGTTINPLAPAKAAFYSAVIPGLGQAYNKKYWKIPIVYAGLGISLYSYTFNQKKYHDFRDEYKRRLDGTRDINHPLYGRLPDEIVLNGQKFHQRNRDLSVLVAAGFYILNIVDANVDAHLTQFNVNENLSLTPNLNQNEIDNKLNTSFKLTYNF